MRRSCSPYRTGVLLRTSLRLHFLIPVFVSDANSKFSVKDRDAAANSCILGESNGTYAESHTYAERHASKGPHWAMFFLGIFLTSGLVGTT